MSKIQKVQKKFKKPVIQNNGCHFTNTNTKPNYKDILILKRFLTDRGKIVPSSISGVSAKNQRKLATEIKKARQIALIPYTERHAL